MKLAATFLLVSFSLLAQSAKPASALDKSTLEAYLRYSELWIPQVSITIDDPKPSTALNGYFDVWVHLAFNGQTKEEMYYVSKDGKNVIKGTAYDISKSPFQANLDMLNQAGKPSFGGKDDAAVNMIVFGDFECPVCQKEETDLRGNLTQKFGSKVRVYFDDFPLTSIHPWAMKASVIGRCMYKLGEPTFWNYHDWIYQNQNTITLETIDNKVQDWAKGQFLDQAKLSACEADKAAQAEVDASMTVGHNLSVSATPTLFINGRKLEGALEWNVLAQLLQIEIDHHDAMAKAAAPASTAKADEKKDDDKCCVVEIPKIGGK